MSYIESRNRGWTMNEPIRAAFDVGAGLVVLGAVAKVLPPMAAMFAIVWHCIQLRKWWIEKKAKEAKARRRIRRKRNASQ
jgi:hypothetical protein